MATVKLKNIDKVYDNNVQAVFNFDLEIKDKEFIVFVGPSGCGKSTTLRMVAGLEEITSGELYIDDELMNEVEPKDRNIAMVFQSYALYPHMTVYENMAFALKLSKLSKEEIDSRVKEAAEILGLTQYLYRKPKALSGGQRQRVALGRAIVRHPKVFLMDEPLSNLDAKLRVQMRSEIIRIHKTVGATTIYVTHDQTEAMTMADRIVCMKDGYVQQIGTPKELYNNPANMFVASFVGSPAMNFISGTFDGENFVMDGDEKVTIKLTDEHISSLKEYPKQMLSTMEFELNETNDSIKEVTELMGSLKNNRRNKKLLKQYEYGLETLRNEIININEKTDAYKKGIYPVVLGVRPEDVHLVSNEDTSNDVQILQSTCEIPELLGSELIVYGKFNGQSLIAKASATAEIKPGDTRNYKLDLNKVYLFDAKSTKRI